MNRVGLAMAMPAIAGWLIAAQATPPPRQPPVVDVVLRDTARHEVRFVEVADNVSLEVLDFGGEGETLILLAGLGDSGHVFDDFATRLTARHRVYAITRRGFGRSSSPDHGYDIATRVADDLAVLEALGQERAVWVGHSIAGEELTALAGRHPDRVRAIVYLDAAFDQQAVAGFETRTPPPRPAMPPPTASQRAPAPTRFESAAAARAWLDGRLRKQVPLGEILATHEFTDDGRVLRERGRPDKASDSIVAAAMPADFAAIRRPALALFPPPPTAVQLAGSGSAEDWKAFSMAMREFVEAQVQRLAAELHGVRIVEIPQTNHYLFLGSPMVVAGEIDGFLREAPAVDAANLPPARGSATTTEQRLDATSQAVMAEIMPGLAADRARLAARPELIAILGPALQGMENDL